MKNKIGGVVAIEPKTGEILAFASSPTYDPGAMVIGKRRGKAFAEINGDPNKPMFNQALMAKYPPALYSKRWWG
ncbi:MAG: penicillin-binding transpeptidase domain-containing protein [Saprospiraceae bacterium]